MMFLRQRDRRAIMLGASVVLAIVVPGRGIPGWKRWVSEERDRARQVQTRVVRLRSIIGVRSRLSDSVRAASRQYLGLAPRLLDGDKPVTAGATLLAMVSNAATGSGLQVGSVQSTGDSAGRRFVRVAVRGEATGDVIGLAEFLETLETGPVITSVRELSVDQPDPGAPAEQSEALRIQFVVEGIGLRRTRVK